jgi:hypothetical protein
MKKDLIYVSLIFFILIVFFQLNYCNDQTTITRITNVKHTHTRPAIYPQNIIKPNPEIINRYIYTTKTDTFIQFDTVYKYITDYLSKKYYSDSILMDSGELIVINDTIHMNSIKSRQISLKYDLKETFIYPKKKKFSIGVHCGYGINTNFEPAPYIGVGVSYNLYSF